MAVAGAAAREGTQAQQLRIARNKAAASARRQATRAETARAAGRARGEVAARLDRERDEAKAAAAEARRVAEAAYTADEGGRPHDSFFGEPLKRAEAAARAAEGAAQAHAQSSAAAEATADQIEFFETRIRPVLVEQCYQCHNSAKTAEGGWRLISARRLSKGATRVRSSFRENRRKAVCWRFCGMRSTG